MPREHTPGPWNLETVRTSVGVCHKIGPLGSETKIKNACLYDDCYSDQPRDLKLLADAVLIAAAPELLDTLKQALRESMCDGDLCCHDWHEAARSIIAKAEGEQ